jgi:RHS repeat-associated protein
VSRQRWLIRPTAILPAPSSNGDRKGVNAGTGGNWAANGTSLPQWVQVDFNGLKTIREIDVFSLQDNFSNPIEPTETTTFSQMGLTAFDVQYWNGSAWTTVPGGSVTGNNKVWKKITFEPVDTSKIRVVINATVDSWTRVVEVEAWTRNIDWLVTDHLGTPRMIIDQAGTLAAVKRHDYLPFGEELLANMGGRSTALGYTGGDGVRQQFTSKERDVETALDYFGARYYHSTQGRFTGVDPYDINLERQNTSDSEEAAARFTDYISQPQHWNRYTYGLNNPQRYIDPDGFMEYETDLLGQKIKVHIDDSIIENDKDALDRIKANLQRAFDKINSGLTKLDSDQIESIHSQNRIYVTNDIDGPGTMGDTFYIPQRTAENPNIDALAADIIHDSRHSEQFARGLSYNEANAIPMEREASLFTLGVIDNVGGWNSNVIANYQVDMMEGHLLSGMRDRSTQKSLEMVFATMHKVQKRRK